MSEDHLPPYRIRPRFQIVTPYSVEALRTKIDFQLKKENAPCKGWVDQAYGSLYLPKATRQYWSPNLQLAFEPQADGSLLKGRYGPHPTVWTMFVFFYSLIAFAIFIVAMLAFANYSLGKPYGLVYSIPVLILLFCSLYFVAYSGQKWGRHQMHILHQFLENSLEMSIV